MSQFNTSNCLQLDQQDLIERFQQANAWEQRYRLLLQLAKQMPSLSNELRQEQYRIQGCENRVWLKHQQSNNTHFFIADSDSRFIKGLLALLVGLANNRNSESIAELKLPILLNQLKLDKHLSPSRNSGLTAVLEQILHYTQ